MNRGKHVQEEISPEAHVRLMDPDEAPTRDWIVITDMSLTVERLLTEALEDGTIGDWNLVFRRCAIILLADPNEYGTPVRCPNCDTIYYVLQDEPFNITLAGFEFTPCIECMISKYPAPPELEAAHEEEDLGWRTGMELTEVDEPGGNMHRREYGEEPEERQDREEEAVPEERDDNDPGEDDTGEDKRAED
jgi:hypothetical protein